MWKKHLGNGATASIFPLGDTKKSIFAADLQLLHLTDVKPEARLGGYVERFIHG
jgi:hypothetical protein